MTRRPSHRPHRGVVLITVLIVIALATLIATAMALRAEARLDAARSAAVRDSLRAAAWSGLQAVMSELAAQRPQLLDGAAPDLTASWTLFEKPSLRATIRLQPFGAAQAESELTKLDLNRADAAMLAKLPGVPVETADRILASRGSRLLAPEELVQDKGLTPAEFYGMPDALTPADPSIPSEPQGLRRFLTVFGFDPNIQSGAGTGPQAKDHAGQFRIQTGLDWTPELEADLATRLSADAVRAAQAALKAKGAAKPSQLVKAMREAGASPAAWGEVLDLFTAQDEQFLSGRVDLGRAPAEVLACLPGISADAATQLVAHREGLSAESRRTLVWPVTEGVLSPEQFEQAVDYLATRSLVWRVRIEVEIGPPPDPTAPADTPERPLGRLAWEAVIDAAAPQPRVAYLRDITYLPAALRSFPEPESDAFEDAHDREVVAETTPESPAISDPSPKQNPPKSVFDIPTSLGFPGLERDNTPSRSSSRPRRVTEKNGGAPGPAGEAAPPGPATTQPLRDRRTGRWGGG